MMGISTNTLAAWEKAEREREARERKEPVVITPPPYARGYRWGSVL